MSEPAGPTGSSRRTRWPAGRVPGVAVAGVDRPAVLQPATGCPTWSTAAGGVPARWAQSGQRSQPISPDALGRAAPGPHRRRALRLRPGRGRRSSPSSSSSEAILPARRAGVGGRRRRGIRSPRPTTRRWHRSPRRLSATPGDSPLNLPLLRSFAVHRPSQPQLHGGDRQLPPHQPRHRHGCSSALGMYPRPTRSISFGSVPVTDGSLLRLALLDPAFEQLDPFWGPRTVARHRAVL